MAISEQQIEQATQRVEESVKNIHDKIIEAVEKLKKSEDVIESEALKDFEKLLSDKTDEQLNKIQAMLPLSDDQYKRELFIFPKLFLNGGMVVQERFIDKQGQITRYGDIYYSGHAMFSGGGWNDVETILPFVKVPFPIGVEITEAIGDGIGIWYIEKEKKKAYYVGIKTTRGQSRSFLLYPVQHTFTSKIKKILVGKTTSCNYPSSNSSSYYLKSHLSIIILENGEAYGYGDNSAQIIKAEDYDKFITTPTKLQIPDGWQVKDGALGYCGYKGSALLICEKGEEQKVFGCGHNVDGELGNGNTSSLSEWRPCLTSGFPSGRKIFNIWMIAMAYSSSWSSSPEHWCSTYFTAGDNENKQFFYGCGANDYKTVNYYGNSDLTTIAELKKDASNANEGESLMNVIDVQGSVRSCVFALTKDKKVYMAGQADDRMGNITYGSWGKWSLVNHGNQNIEKIYFHKYNVWSSSHDLKDGILVFLTGDHVNWTGVDKTRNTSASSLSQGYEEFWNDEKLQLDKGLCVSSADIEETKKGAIFYGIDKTGRHILVYGKKTTGNILPADSVGFNYLPYHL